MCDCMHRGLGKHDTHSLRCGFLVTEDCSSEWWASFEFLLTRTSIPKGCPLSWLPWDEM